MSTTADTFVVVTKAHRTSGNSSWEGPWTSDGVAYPSVKAARAEIERRRTRERKAGSIWMSRGGHFGAGYIWRVWTAAEWTTFRETGRVPFGGSI